MKILRNWSQKRGRFAEKAKGVQSVRMTVEEILSNPSLREEFFPIVKENLFFAHAAIAPVSGPGMEALCGYSVYSSISNQDSEEMWGVQDEARRVAARATGCEEEGVSLLGPTALGLNLVALGIDWKEGDEVLFYKGDYPTNVYPWANLASQGVRPVEIVPEVPGEITWEVIEPLLTDRTRLVALASASFLTGYCIDIDRIGLQLHENGVLFCLDAIQTLGAFPTSMEHVDFLSADSHKWMLGPMGAGIFCVRKHSRKHLRPALLGSWNVVSPDFAAQDEIEFYPGGRSFEPGCLNITGIAGMTASLRLLNELGVEAVSERIRKLRGLLAESLKPLGYRPFPEGRAEDHERYSGILSLELPEPERQEELAGMLKKERVSVSWRQGPGGTKLLRISPHFYNTEDEVQKLVELLSR